MDIEKMLNELNLMSEYIEYYSRDCVDSPAIQASYMNKRARRQQEIVDYVHKLEETAWKYEDSQR